MPPRFAYWTILIDNAPTAFRARDPEELRPTLAQLKRTNPNVVMKWFARGRLWESMEQEHEDFQRNKVQEKEIATGGRVAITRTRERDSTRRSGVATSASSVPTAMKAHPRTPRRAAIDRRVNAPGKTGRIVRGNQSRKAIGPGATGRRGAIATDRGRTNPSRHAAIVHGPPSRAAIARGNRSPLAIVRGKENRRVTVPGNRSRLAIVRGKRSRPVIVRGKAKPPGDRPWKPKPAGDRPWKGKPAGDRPWKPKPPGDRPWQAKPAGDRPWKSKPPGDRPWKPKPAGDRPWKPKVRNQRPWPKDGRPSNHDPKKKRDDE